MSQEENPIFYLLNVVPNEFNQNIKLGGEQIAYCWVTQPNKVIAYKLLLMALKTIHFEVASVEIDGIRASKEVFDQPFMIQCFEKALVTGEPCITIINIDDENADESKVERLEPEFALKSKKDIGVIKSKPKTEMCMHFNAGLECNDIIGAHSIQNSQMLENIAVKGKVYKFDSVKERFSLKGIKKEVSIFRGFCGRHDNKLFEPIDNQVLKPSTEQSLLYAYRSLCKELFAQYQAMESFEKSLSCIKENHCQYDVISTMLANVNYAAKHLEERKLLLELDIGTNAESNLATYAVHFKGEPNIAVSTVINPKFDFEGKLIQRLSLSDNNSPSHLYIATAPTNNGWCILLSWDTKVDTLTEEFVDVLLKQEENIPDCLFRLIFSTCDNFAISPKWFDSLSKEAQEEMQNKTFEVTHSYYEDESNYLIDTLSGIGNWQLDFINKVTK